MHKQMMHEPKPESVAASLTVPERILLFCIGSGMDWQKRREATMSGVVDNGHDSGHGETDAIDPDRTFAQILSCKCQGHNLLLLWRNFCLPREAAKSFEAGRDRSSCLIAP
jgi:hypothetical protein